MRDFVRAGCACDIYLADADTFAPVPFPQGDVNDEVVQKTCSAALNDDTQYMEINLLQTCNASSG